MSSSDTAVNILPLDLSRADPPPPYGAAGAQPPLDSEDARRGMPEPIVPEPAPVTHDTVAAAPIVMWCTHVVYSVLALVSYLHCPMEGASGLPNVTPVLVVAAGPAVMAWVRHGHPRYSPRVLGMAYAVMLVIVAWDLNRTIANGDAGASSNARSVHTMAELCCCGALAVAICITTSIRGARSDAWHAKRFRTGITCGVALIPSIMLCFVTSYYMANFRAMVDSSINLVIFAHHAMVATYIIGLACIASLDTPGMRQLVATMPIAFEVSVGVLIVMFTAVVLFIDGTIVYPGSSSSAVAAHMPIVHPDDVRWLAKAILGAMAIRIMGILVMFAFHVCHAPRVRAALREIQVALPMAIVNHDH